MLRTRSPMLKSRNRSRELAIPVVVGQSLVAIGLSLFLGGCFGPNVNVIEGQMDAGSLPPGFDQFCQPLTDPSPSPEVSPSPSVLPSPESSPTPTSVPSPLPSPLPSSEPTPDPSAEPSPLPTVHCLKKNDEINEDNNREVLDRVVLIKDNSINMSTKFDLFKYDAMDTNPLHILVVLDNMDKEKLDESKKAIAKLKILLESNLPEKQFLFRISITPQINPKPISFENFQDIKLNPFVSSSLPFTSAMQGLNTLRLEKAYTSQYPPTFVAFLLFHPAQRDSKDDRNLHATQVKHLEVMEKGVRMFPGAHLTNFFVYGDLSNVEPDERITLTADKVQTINRTEHAEGFSGNWDSQLVPIDDFMDKFGRSILKYKKGFYLDDVVDSDPVLERGFTLSKPLGDVTTPEELRVARFRPPNDRKVLSLRNREYGFLNSLGPETGQIGVSKRFIVQLNEEVLEDGKHLELIEGDEIEILYPSLPPNTRFDKARTEREKDTGE